MQRHLLDTSSRSPPHGAAASAAPNAITPRPRPLLPLTTTANPARHRLPLTRARGKGQQQPQKGSGGGGGGGNSNSSTRRSNSSDKRNSGGAGNNDGRGARPPPPSPPPPPSALTPALAPAAPAEPLGPWEPAPEPRWGTFAGLAAGEWVGEYGAYAPWDGSPEPVWAGGGGGASAAASPSSSSFPSMPSPSSYQDHAYTRFTEFPEEGAVVLDPAAIAGDAPRCWLVRRVARGGTPATALLAAAVADGPAGGENDADDGRDVERAPFNAGGMVAFEGGMWSAGPARLGDFGESLLREADEAAEAAAAAEAGGGAPLQQEDDEEEAQALLDDAQELPIEEAAGEEEGEGDDWAAPPAVIEAALSWAGGQRRVRLVATLKAAGGGPWGAPGGGEELDVDVARVVLHRERWQGPIGTKVVAAKGGGGGSSSSSSSSKGGFGGGGGGGKNAPAAAAATTPPPAVPCSRLPRLDPSALEGAWDTFVISATPLPPPPQELAALGIGGPSLAYAGRRERGVWALGGGGGGGDGGGGGGGGGEGGDNAVGGAFDGLPLARAPPVEGGTLWLPGGCFVTFRMVEPEDGAEDPRRGFCVAFGWAPGLDGSAGGGGFGSGLGSSGGVNGGGNGAAAGEGGENGGLLVMEREYAPDGALREVRLVSGCRGGWVGGRM